MNHQQKAYQKLTIPLLSYGYRKCTFVDSLNEYIDSSNSVHYWVAIVDKKTWRRGSITFKHTRGIFMMFVLWSWFTPNYTPIKYICLTKKSNQRTLAHLVFHSRVVFVTYHACGLWQHAYNEHLQLCLHMWPLVGIANYLLQFGESWRLLFQVSKSALRCKTYKRSKWSFIFLFKQSYRPSHLCYFEKLEWIELSYL